MQLLDRHALPRRAYRALGRCTILVLLGAASITAPLTASAASVRYVYDQLGRLVGVVDPSGQTATYTYDAAGNVTAINVNPQAPAIADFTPACAAAGAVLTISGTAFAPTAAGNTVTVNGIAAPVSSATSTQLVVTVPAGNTAGAITVNTTGGAASGPSPFSGSCGAPTISSFSPTAGIASSASGSGTTVIITGTNFDPISDNDVVMFGVSRATVGTATTTSLSVTLPEGAASGPITVRTRFGSASSTQDFFVVPVPHVVGDVDTKIRTRPGQTVNVAITTPGHVALILFDGHEGEQISIVGTPGASWRITLITPYGPVDVPNPPCGNSKAVVRTTTLPATGTYAIVVDDPAGAATGSIGVTVNDVADVTLPIAVNVHLPVNTTTPGQKTRLVFAGKQNKRVSLSVTADTLSCCYNYVSILGPDGGYLHDPVRIDSGGFLDVRTLPTSGNYTILLDPAVNTGIATFSLNRVPADVARKLSLKRTLKFKKPGQNAHVTFNGTAGAQVNIARSAETLPAGSTDLTIFNPDKSLLVPPTAGSPGTFTLPQTGTYEILVDPIGPATGSVTLTLNNCALGGC